MKAQNQYFDDSQCEMLEVMLMNPGRDLTADEVITSVVSLDDLPEQERTDKFDRLIKKVTCFTLAPFITTKKSEGQVLYQVDFYDETPLWVDDIEPLVSPDAQE